MKINFEIKYVKLFALSACIGAVVGFIVSIYRIILYKLSVNVFYVSNFIFEKWYYPIILFAFLISMGCLIGYILTQYPQIRGAGVPQIKYYISLHEPKNIFFEILFKLFGSMISFASGISL